VIMSHTAGLRLARTSAEHHQIHPIAAQLSPLQSQVLGQQHVQQRH